MKHYAGLDVSVKKRPCIVDEAGRICREMKVVSHPEDLLAVLCDPAWPLERVGLRLASVAVAVLMAEGVPAICIETRHAKAFLKAQVNESDRNDARGIAQMMRVGLFRPVHVKTLASQKRRALLAARKILQEKALAIENDIRGLLRNFGLKVGIVGVVGFEQRIHDLVEGVPELADIMEPLLAARRVLREKFAKLHRKVLLLARDNEVCQRLMTIPGVGPSYPWPLSDGRRSSALQELEAARRRPPVHTFGVFKNCENDSLVGRLREHDGSGQNVDSITRTAITPQALRAHLDYRHHEPRLR